jgi:hypothetical protein
MSTVPRSLFVHAGLVAIAAIGAASVWTRDKSAKPDAQTEVTVWTGRAGDVEYVAYEAKGKKVTIEPRSDAQGKWYFGSIEKEPTSVADGGVPPAKTTSAFVSTTAAGKLLDDLAPLKAVRDVGKVPAERVEEFGLKTPEATLVVKLGGVEHRLDVGGAAPGGADRYVRDPASGTVYAIRADLVRDFDWADSRLLEHDLHGWKENEVASATLLAGGKNRKLVRGGPGNHPFWADPATPDKNDETAGNWMQKLDRLRPSEYLEHPPEGRSTVVRVEYAGTSGALGWIELVKTPGASGKSDYFVATEHTRLYGKVIPSFAEQVESDLGSVLK